ncbi:MAG: hypothetical protein J7498_04415 [Sphingobium sp.]|nr:hypothetical protein [Sphingobium sp.]
MIRKTSTAFLTAAILAFPATSGMAQKVAAPAAAPAVDKVMAHNDRGRSGWNDKETVLNPANVAGGSFGPLWASPQFDSFNATPPRLFSAPLYLHAVKMTAGPARGQTLGVTYVSTTAGYAYAVATRGGKGIAPGTILWKTRLTEAPCNKGQMGNYGTGILDPKTNRFYVTSCGNTKNTDSSGNMWNAHALDLGTGQQLAGWPVALSQTMIDNPALNRNGKRTWRMAENLRYVQRGALNLSADGQRLYLAFGADSVGWMLVLDTVQKKVVSAFSATPDDEQNGGGMWAQGGPAVDEQGRLYVSTGSNLNDGIAMGYTSMHPDQPNSWAHSILQFQDDRTNGLILTGTYTPYNYCQSGKADIDIGSSPVIVVDLPAGSSATTRLLSLGGGKQGNIYLLDRDRMPGGAYKRHGCQLDPAEDLSLLAPEVQPEWKRRGPINLFKPFSDEFGAYDQAKSRTSASYYRDDAGKTWIYVNGASKKGESFNTSMPPGLAKVAVIASPGADAFLRVDKLEMTKTFHNPGSPVISSNAGRDAIIWMIDQNAPRTVNLFGTKPPQPLLYAFDAATLKPIYQSEVGQLFPTGNYGEPSVVEGMVLIGTDRLQAFGLKAK